MHIESSIDSPIYFLGELPFRMESHNWQIATKIANVFGQAGNGRHSYKKKQDLDIFLRYPSSVPS